MLMMFIAVVGSWAEARCCSPFPVGAQGRCLTVQMQYDYLGNKLAMPPVPLKSKLYVGTRGVPMLESVVANMVAIINQ